jgi:hypothetical protein
MQNVRLQVLLRSEHHTPEGANRAADACRDLGIEPLVLGRSTLVARTSMATLAKVFGPEWAKAVRALPPGGADVIDLPVPGALDELIEGLIVTPFRARGVRS